VRFVVNWDDRLVFPMAGERLIVDKRADARSAALRFGQAMPGVFWVEEWDGEERTVSVEQFDPEIGQWKLRAGVPSVRDLPEDP
jgi:hypothetical protein